jgi:hypothetical protein
MRMLCNKPTCTACGVHDLGLGGSEAGRRFPNFNQYLHFNTVLAMITVHPSWLPQTGYLTQLTWRDQCPHLTI